MEPRPSVRRSSPPQSAAPVSPGGEPSHYEPDSGQPPYPESDVDATAYGDYASNDPYDQAGAYQEPQALGPLPGGQPFEPNASLPPTRPLYDPFDPNIERANLTLHPVGRVPRDGQPLNLRPAPPPMPMEVPPKSNRGIIRAAIAAGIGIATILLLLFAINQFFGNGDDDNQIAAEQTATRTTELDERATIEARLGFAATPEATATTDPTEGETAAGAPQNGSNDDADAATAEAGPDDAEEAPEPPATSPPTAPAEPGVAAQSDDATARPPASISSASIADFLPADNEVPAGLVLGDENDRSLADVVATFADPVEAEQLLTEWGWDGNSYREFVGDGSGESTIVQYLNVSVHEFGTTRAASDALDYFAQVLIDGGYTVTDADRIGNEMIALSVASEEANLAVLYIRSGSFLIRVGTSSATDDPLPETLTFTEAILE